MSGLLAPSALALAAAPAIIPPDAYKNLTPLASLRPYDKNVDCRFIVTGPPEEIRSTKEGGTVYTILVADESGAMLATFWDEQGAAMRPGDVILMRAGLVTLFKGHLRLACKQGTLHRIDRYLIYTHILSKHPYSYSFHSILLCRFKMAFKETPNVSDLFWTPSHSNPNELVPSVKNVNTYSK